MSHSIIKPLKEVMPLDEIQRKVQALSINDVFEILNSRGIVIWPIVVRGIELLIVKDFETRYRDRIWASNLVTPNAITLFFNINYGIKIYTLRGLYNIVRGILVHEAYENMLKLLYPEVETEVKVYDNELGIVGIADIVLDGYVIEIKSGKRLKGHTLQLVAYMKALKKMRGALVYPHKVVELWYTNDLEHQLLRTLDEVRKLQSFVINHDLDEVLKRYREHYKRFKARFSIEPKDLYKALEKEGFI